MDAFFLDSSGLVKRYSVEAGTAWLFGVVRPSANNSLYLARITGVEIISTLSRKIRGGRLTQNQADKAGRRFEREFLNRYSIIEVSPQIVFEAMNLAKIHFLRGYDAVQLAAALQVHRRRKSLNLSPLIFVSADNDLNAAAAAENLTVENPNNYP